MQFRPAETWCSDLFIGRNDGDILGHRHSILGTHLVLHSENALIECAALHEIVVGAEVDDFALAHHQHLVGPANLGEAVGGEQGGAPFQHAVNGGAGFVLRCAVGRGASG